MWDKQSSMVSTCVHWWVRMHSLSSCMNCGSKFNVYLFISSCSPQGDSVSQKIAPISCSKSEMIPQQLYTYHTQQVVMKGERSTTGQWSKKCHDELSSVSHCSSSTSTISVITSRLGSDFLMTQFFRIAFLAQLMPPGYSMTLTISTTGTASD